MHWDLHRGAVCPMVLFITCFLFALKSATAITATVDGDNNIIVSLQPSDVTNGSSLYYVKITQSVNLTNYKIQFKEFNSTLPPPVVFPAAYHGIYYLVTLLVGNTISTVKPVHLVAVLTKPLPVSNVAVYDYKLFPETGVLFEIQYPKETTNFFSRLKLSYFKGEEYQSSFHKDFLKGKLIFNNWVPGTCYSNITLQLVAEANVNRVPLMEYSAVGHEPKHHRTVPYPPGNVSMKIVYGKRNNSSVEVHAGREESFVDTNRTADETTTINVQVNNLTAKESLHWGDYNTTGQGNDEMINMNWTPEFQQDSREISASGSDYFDIINVSEEDQQSIIYTTTEPELSETNAEEVWLVLEWLPPKPPTVYDHFNIYVQKEGNSTEIFTAENGSYAFKMELQGPAKYEASVTTVSSSGICGTRESSSRKTLTFYLSPTGKWFEEITKRPENIVVKVLNSTAAKVSWKHSQETSYDSIVSVISISCQKQFGAQRIESHYCTEVNLSSTVIPHLIPGGYYQVIVYLRNGPAIGPPSLPVTFGLDPSGVKDISLYPLGPSAAILSWSRPYSVVFDKYVVEMYHHDPVNQNSKWKTIQDIPATIALTTSMTVGNLLPAARYEFRVTMVSGGEPEHSCCDNSSASYTTAPLAPEITRLEYSKNILSLSWKYGDTVMGESNSTLPYWLVVAVGRRIIKKSVPRSVMTTVLRLPPGDIYNLTVVAYTEGSSNTSAPRLVQLDPAPPKSLFAVNKTQTSVTLLWVEEGITDHYEVICKQIGSSVKGKKEEATVYSTIVTLDNLVPSTSYNCSVISVSYDSYSQPVFIAVSTTVTELNSNMVVISALAILSILLIGLLLITLFVLRRKHLQHTRNCGAGIFVNFATLERDGKIPFNWRRSIFAVLALLPSCLWTDYLLAFGINPWNKYALKKRKLTNPVQLDDFEMYLKDMARDSDYKFSLQFEDLKLVAQDVSHDTAELPVNRCKNRYTNILPYDFSRVKLVSLHDEEGSDYINANYIPGYNSPHEYIATQGPLAETRRDFWRMVLQQKSHIIVMLTQCNERRRVKCDHYWPFNKEPVCYGDITVEMVFESELPDQSEDSEQSEQPEWIIREFNVSYADAVQRVIHYNYMAWPDHGVPNADTAENILQFVQMIRQQTVKRPGSIIVHCSAGVGRTGTLIALDRLMQHIHEHEYVDILGLVSEMRMYRTSMVQTEEQYIFIHRCVQLMWKKKRQQYNSSDVIYENVSPSQL
ncbi:receptor-type tyrosine-protein phosphatase O [Callorhinchus milii]|uniref:receptor-type tyrosine-protein phosphatase O n=1 Tax=Callorhinchus milii TaxID=7868 RepID=UPI001C3FC32B|nr:receptor-type tyrosine-protein phosphatase O [Callorhinchus milii]